MSPDFNLPSRLVWQIQSIYSKAANPEQRQKELQVEKLLSATWSPCVDGSSFSFPEHSRRNTGKLLTLSHEFIHRIQKYSKTAIEKEFFSWSHGACS